MCGGNRHWRGEPEKTSLPPAVFYAERPENGSSTCERRFAECYAGAAAAAHSRQHRIAMALAHAIRTGNMLSGTIFAGSRLDDGRIFVASANVSCDSPPAPAFVRDHEASASSVFWMMERRVALVATLIKGGCTPLELRADDGGYLIASIY